MFAEQVVSASQTTAAKIFDTSSRGLGMVGGSKTMQFLVRLPKPPATKCSTVWVRLPCGRHPANWHKITGSVVALESSSGGLIVGTQIGGNPFCQKIGNVFNFIEGPRCSYHHALTTSPRWDAKVASFPCWPGCETKWVLKPPLPSPHASGQSRPIQDGQPEGSDH